MSTPILVQNALVANCCGAPPGFCRCGGDPDAPTLNIVAADPALAEWAAKLGEMDPDFANDTDALNAGFAADFQARLARNEKLTGTARARLPDPELVGNAADDVLDSPNFAGVFEADYQARRRER